MTASKWKDIVELIGIAAIVASLVAVVIELRQTQAALAAATYQARAFDAIESARQQYSGDYIVPILTRVDLFDPVSLDTLNDEEKSRLRAFFIAQMIDFDNEYYQYQQGFLDEEYYEYWFKGRLPGVAQSWRNLGVREMRPSFRAFVDEQLEEASH